MCPSHLSLPHHEVSHAGLVGGGQQLSGGGAVWAAVEVSSCAPCASVRVNDSAATYTSHGSTKDVKNLSLEPSPTILGEKTRKY